MKVVAFVPIKLTNQRLPGKNLLPLAGKALCQHIFETLLRVDGVDEVFAYCSDEKLCDFLPKDVRFLQRNAELDGDMVKGSQIYKEFLDDVHADVYILAHATSPFVGAPSIKKGLDAVLSGRYDSSFSAEKVQTFAWYKGKPLNYSLGDVPRTQDINPVWIETSAFYIFKRGVFENDGQRIGHTPFIVETSGLENIDIDERCDYEMAQLMIGDKKYRFSEIANLEDD